MPGALARLAMGILAGARGERVNALQTPAYLHRVPAMVFTMCDKCIIAVYERRPHLPCFNGQEALTRLADVHEKAISGHALSPLECYLNKIAMHAVSNMFERMQNPVRLTLYPVARPLGERRRRCPGCHAFMRCKDATLIDLGPVGYECRCGLKWDLVEL